MDPLDFPRVIQIETINICNHACTFCFSPDLAQARKETMDIDDFEVIAKDIGSHQDEVERVNPTGWGEPTIDEHYLERLHLLERHAPEVEVFQFTNGTQLDEEKAREILEHGLIDEIHFSIDGGNQEAISATVQRDSQEDMLQNIRRIAEIRDEYDHDIRLEANMVTTPTNIHSVDEFYERWSPIVDAVIPKPMANGGGQHFSLDEGDRPEASDNPHCHWFTEKMRISHDGSVPLCCHDGFAVHDFGNVLDSSIEAVWHSDAMNEVREQFSEAEWDDLPLCSDCSMIAPDYQDTDYFDRFHEARRDMVDEDSPAVQQYESMTQEELESLATRRDMIVSYESEKLDNERFAQFVEKTGIDHLMRKGYVPPRVFEVAKTSYNKLRSL